MRTRTVRPITNSEKSHYLVRRLGSRDAEERRLAKDEFMRLAAENPALFHADLADIIRAITGNKRRISIGIPALLAASYPASRLLSTSAQSLDAIFPIAGAIGIFLLAGWGIIRATIGRRRKRLAECITDIDDLHALPALIELLEFTNPAVQDAIMPSITRLLARLRAADAYLLGFLHRTALARMLSTPRARKLPASFFVSVLQAFEQIGDSQALPAVSWLAQGKGVARGRPTIQEAAQACLSHLQEQLRRHQAPYLLLRPSGPAEDSHALLRSVVNAPDAAPHELLRADTPSPRRPVSVLFRPQTESSEPLSIGLRKYKGP